MGTHCPLESSHSEVAGLQLLQSTFSPFLAFSSIAYSGKAGANLRDAPQALTAVADLGFQPSASNFQSPDASNFWALTILGGQAKGAVWSWSSGAFV